MPKILSYIKPPPTHINLRYTPGRHDDKKDSTLLYHLIPVILQMYVKKPLSYKCVYRLLEIETCHAPYVQQFAFLCPPEPSCQLT